MGKNLESACKAYAYRSYVLALTASEKVAEAIFAAGGLKAAPKELVAEFVAKTAAADELLAKVA